MTILTPEQVAGIVMSGGLPSGTTAAQWVAKARQESGNNTDAISTTGCCVGLWQVNVDAHRDLIPEYDVSRANAVSVMKSPLRNWNVTTQIYAKDGWDPWRASGGRPTPNPNDIAATTKADTTVAKSGAGDLGGAIPGLGRLDPIQALSDALGKIVDPLVAAAKWIGNPSNWIRVVQVVGGVTLALIAGYIVAQPTIESARKTVA